MLPFGWKGVCTLGALVPSLTLTDKAHRQEGWLKTFVKRIKKTHNAIAERPTGFHRYARWFPLWLGRSELEKAIVNIPAVIKNFENRTTDALSALQTEVSNLSKAAIQNRMALDLLLASQGGVCTIVTISFCVHVVTVINYTKVVDSPSVEIFKTRLDEFLCNLL